VRNLRYFDRRCFPSNVLSSLKSESWPRPVGLLSHWVRNLRCIVFESLTTVNMFVGWYFGKCVSGFGSRPACGWLWFAAPGPWAQLMSDGVGLARRDPSRRGLGLLTPGYRPVVPG
jgi:hypothetical protein